MNIGVNINLNQHEIQNAIIQNLGSDPGSPLTGQFWFNTATGKLMYRDASGNRDVTYLAQVVALRLDQFAVPTADLNINSHKLTNVTDGSSAQDAVTFAQLQSVQQAKFFKDAVRVTTTANITLSGTQTIDGVSVVAGERVLVKNQTTGSENGIYVVASGAWTRATDADVSAEMKSGTTVFVSEGTVSADKQFSLTTNDPITLGTTALVFAITGAGTTYIQGTGITISGSTIAIDATVVPSKFSADIGDGSTTAIVVTHNLGTKDIHVSVRKKSTDEVWLADVTATSITTATISFATAPASNEFRVTIFG